MPEGGAISRSAVERVTVWLLLGATLVAVAIGLLVRLRILSTGSLWIDELWTLDAISRSFKEMVGARLISDQHPPLWSSVAWFWLRLVGTYDAGAMRALPLGLGVAAIAAPLIGAIRLRSLRPTLLVMAALTAVSLFSLQYSVELRSYSMMIAFGTIATVIWAGLLSSELPRTWPWILGFTATGALAGFTHYYGHLLYVGELLVLVVLWLPRRPRRPLGVLLCWGGLSLLPVTGWYLVTRSWFPVRPIAPEPSLDIVRAWLAYGFSPFTNVFARRDPGYPSPDVARGSELLVGGLVVALIVGAIVIRLRARRALGPSQLVGGAVLFVLALGVGGAWVGSLVLPPSMNSRNLSALLPVLYIAVGCAATPGSTDRINRLIAAGVIAVWVAALLILVAQFGIPAFTPPWQAQAGYRATVQTLLTARQEDPSISFIGLKSWWDWHGQWDAAGRSVLGRPPAESGDAEPLDVHWILSVQELQPAGLPASALIVFTDASDDRSTRLFEWLQEVRRGCGQSAFGGPGFGSVMVFHCPASP